MSSLDVSLGQCFMLHAIMQTRFMQFLSGDGFRDSGNGLTSPKDSELMQNVGLDLNPKGCLLLDHLAAPHSAQSSQIEAFSASERDQQEQLRLPWRLSVYLQHRNSVLACALIFFAVAAYILQTVSLHRNLLLQMMKFLYLQAFVEVHRK